MTSLDQSRNGAMVYALCREFLKIGTELLFSTQFGDSNIVSTPTTLIDTDILLMEGQPETKSNEKL